MTTIQILNVLLFIPIMVICVILSYRLVFRVLYKERIKQVGVLDTNLQNLSPLSTIARRLVNRFDSSIGFALSEDPLSLAEAASFGSRPAYIVFSIKLLEHSSGEHPYFDDNDILALAAHELGHIVSKSRLEMHIIVMMSIFLIVISMAFWFQMFALLLLLFPLLTWLGFVSRKEEYRADSFAVSEAGLSVQQFTKSLVKSNEFLMAQRKSMGYSSNNNLVDRFIKLFFSSHPSVEQRISRLKALYEKSHQ